MEREPEPRLPAVNIVNVDLVLSPVRVQGQRDQKEESDARGIGGRAESHSSEEEGKASSTPRRARRGRPCPLAEIRVSASRVAAAIAQEFAPVSVTVTRSLQFLSDLSSTDESGVRGR